MREQWVREAREWEMGKEAETRGDIKTKINEIKIKLIFFIYQNGQCDAWWVQLVKYINITRYIKF